MSTVNSVVRRSPASRSSRRAVAGGSRSRWKSPSPLAVPSRKGSSGGGGSASFSRQYGTARPARLRCQRAWWTAWTGSGASCAGTPETRAV